ncbi:MAG: hypothetical protein CMO34_03155 [Verrucomicrobia bacterium]|nr:hypothetical protein [Verrucomicrobiota bacterium]|tara:strand:+ start:1981 stop:2415 length:435 start_codon:yes stop_codon:yes gene_type:complete
MKWNWGTKIALVYTAFVGFILYMVYISFLQDFDLVTEDYYAEEIKYQETIDKKANTDGLAHPIKAQIKNGQLNLTFPPSDNNIKGKLIFFRPSDSGLDFEHTFETESKDVYVPLDNFKSGKYLVKSDWSSNDQSFYQEITIVIP